MNQRNAIKVTTCIEWIASFSKWYWNHLQCDSISIRSSFCIDRDIGLARRLWFHCELLKLRLLCMILYHDSQTHQSQSSRILSDFRLFHHPSENPIQLLWSTKNNIETDFFWYMAKKEGQPKIKKQSTQTKHITRSVKSAKA